MLVDLEGQQGKDGGQRRKGGSRQPFVIKNKQNQTEKSNKHPGLDPYASFPYSVASYWSANQIQGDGGQGEGNQQENQIFQGLIMFFSNLIKLLNSSR